MPIELILKKVQVWPRKRADGGEEYDEREFVARVA